MEESYVDTVLIEANRKTSPQYLAGNNDSPNKWTNDCGTGIKLEVGDQISVHSAFISEVGNESATIEIKGTVATNNLNEGQTYNSSDTTKVKGENVDDVAGQTTWDYTPVTQTNLIRDDEINLTHSYYKTTNGEYYVSLPRRSAWNSNLSFLESAAIWTEYNGSENGQVDYINPYRADEDYAYVQYYGYTNGEGGGPIKPPPTTRGTPRNEIVNDGQKYTLFVNQKIFNFRGTDLPRTSAERELYGHRDPALFDFIWYKKTHNYKIKQGFNSPADVAQSFTDQMSTVEDLSYQQVTHGGMQDTLNRNFSLVANSKTNEPFPCAFGSGFQSANGDNYLNYRNGNDVGIRETKTSPMTAGSAYKNQIYVNNHTDLVPGMWLIATSNVAADWAAIVGRCKIISLSTGADPGMPANNSVFMDREVPNFNIHDTFTFGWLDPNETYDYYYQSCYATIGYKRPEIQETGRNVNDNYSYAIDGSYCVSENLYHPMSSASNVVPWMIPTTIRWTENNLLRLKKFFASQKNYPEVYKFGKMSAGQQGLIAPFAETNITIDKSRFIHMNINSLHHQVNPVINQLLVPAGTNKLRVTAPMITQGIGLGSMLYDQADEYFYSSFGTQGVNDRKTYIIYIEQVGADFDIYLSQNARKDVPAATVGFYFLNQRLGTDGYYPSTLAGRLGDLFVSHSAALFIDFNKDREELDEGYGEGPVPFNTLRYGLFYRYHHADLGYVIGFWTGGPNNKPLEGVNGIDVGFFTDDGGGTIWGNTSSAAGGGAEIVSYGEPPRCLGFDMHFNAFSTASLMLWNGLSGKFGNNFGATKEFVSYQDRDQVDGEPQNAATDEVYPYGPAGMNNNYLCNEVYMGANDPALAFDSDQSRFGFNQLHSAEVVGNSAIAGVAVTDATSMCYKINKRLSRLNYSPNFIPYNNTSSTTLPKVVTLDRNIIPYSIMDAHSGIFFEDYGCNERYWNKSLWELLGFTYNQFHQTTDNRLVRSTDLPLTTSTPTTNALIQSADLINWGKVTLDNADETQIASLEPEKIPYPTWGYKSVVAGAKIFPAARGMQDFREIVQNCSSTSITAVNLPRKMMSPIYLVKSDILAPTYIGGQKGTSKMPVVAVVPKDNGYGDFYTSDGGQVVFTNTQERTIQNISVDICDADGSASRVDDSCCVIFKIQKEIASNKNVLSSILTK